MNNHYKTFQITTKSLLYNNLFLYFIISHFYNHYSATFFFISFLFYNYFIATTTIINYH